MRMLHLKHRKNPIDMEKVTITKAVKFSILHYALLALMITCIVLRAQQNKSNTLVEQVDANNNSIPSLNNRVEKDNLEAHLMDKGGREEPDFKDCAYSVDIKRNVFAWEPFKIIIKFNTKRANVIFSQASTDENTKVSGKNLSTSEPLGNDEPRHPHCSFDDQDGGSTFRIQVYSVYEMTGKTTTYIGNGTYETEVLLTVPAKYVVMVFVTYIHHQANETRYHVRPLLQQLRDSPFEVMVARKRKTAVRQTFHLSNSSANTDSRRKSSTTARYCSRNESGASEGRWLKCSIGAVRGTAEASSYTKTEQCGPWQSTEFDFDKVNGFRWLPYHCQYHLFTNDEVKRCFARNGWDSIVFAGDSHMRYRAYHWATRLYGSCPGCVKTHIQMVFNRVPRIEWVFDARGTRLPLSFPNITLPIEKYVHPQVRRSKFSTPFSKEAIDSKLFLFNFGHWVLRETYYTEFMEQKLHSYGRAAQYLMNQGKTVIWVNTVSLPWRLDRAVKLWRENTSPQRVTHFNKLADRIIESYGIPTVNAFSISDGRIGATHDQTHYTKKLPGNEYGGVVENAISNVIFNKLCR